MKRIFYILVITIIPLLAVGQSLGCQTYLHNVEKFYRSGDYLSVVQGDSLLARCKYSKNEKILIYKYLIPALTNLGFDSLADQYTFEFLKLNPFYQYQQQVDPLPLQNIMYRFYTFPRFTIGYMGGLDRVFIDKIAVHSLLDSINYDVPYRSHFSFFSLVFFDLNFTKSLALGLSIGFIGSNYSRSLLAYNFLQINYLEYFISYHVNAYMKLNLNFMSVKGYIPYFKLGGFWEYTPKYEAELTLTSINDTLYPDFVPPLKNSETYYYKETERNLYRYGYLAGFGIKKDFQRTTAFLEILWTRDKDNFVPNNSNLVPELIPRFYYVSDDFYFNRLLISLGISLNLHYVVKKKF